MSHLRRAFITLATLSLSLSLGLSPLRAEALQSATTPAAAATTTATATYRVVGLFEPEREQDLKEVIKILPALDLVSLNYETTEATFRYDVSKLINAYNPKKPPNPETIEKNIDNLLRNASNGTFTLKPGPPLSKDKLQDVKLEVGILHCRGCRYGAYQVVAKVEGVEQATITPNGQLTAWIDKAKTNQGAIEEALKKARIDVLSGK